MQTYQQLVDKGNCSKRAIQRKIHLYIKKFPPNQAREVIVLIYTTYCIRSFSVMLFIDAITKENLLKNYVNNETNRLYQ